MSNKLLTMAEITAEFQRLYREATKDLSPKQKEEFLKLMIADWMTMPYQGKKPSTE